MSERLSKLAQFVFILMFAGIIIAQYFMEGIIKKEIPMSIILFIGGIAAGVRSLGDITDKLTGGGKDKKKDKHE